MASTLETQIKIEELCRTCLSKDGELFSIFDVYLGSTVTLDYIVTSTTGLEVNYCLYTIFHLHINCLMRIFKFSFSVFASYY